VEEIMLGRILSLAVLGLVSAIGAPGIAQASAPQQANPVVNTRVGCQGTTTVRTLVLNNRRSTRPVTFRIRNSRPSGQTIRSEVTVPAHRARVRRVRVRHQGWVADIGVRANGRQLLDTVLVGHCN
jgi:hypothetical protein